MRKIIKKYIYIFNKIKLIWINTFAIAICCVESIIEKSHSIQPTLD